MRVSYGIIQPALEVQMLTRRMRFELSASSRETGFPKDLVQFLAERAVPGAISRAGTQSLTLSKGVSDRVITVQACVNLVP